MEQTVRVICLLPEQMAQVQLVRQSACSGDCHQCAGCGAAKQTLIFQARNPIGAVPGDVVSVQSDASPVLKAAAMLYLLPLALFVTGYLLGQQLGGYAVLASLCGFGLGLLPVRALDRYLRGKMVYTITDFAGKRSC